MSASRRIWLAPLVLFSLTVAVHWRTLLTKQYQSFDSPDFAYQVAPWLETEAREMHHGHWPLLWNPYMMGGHPLLGQGQPGVVFPLNWLLIMAPTSRGFLTGRDFNWYMAIIRFIAALSMYALCRDLQRSRLASIFAASAFAFSGYIATVGWPQMLNGGILAPLVLMFTLRSLRITERSGQGAWFNAVASGGLLGLSWLSGHHQIPLFVTLAVCAVWIYHIVKAQPAAARIMRVKLFAAFGVIMILASAAQTLPEYSYGQTVVRWVGASHEVQWDQPVPYSVHDLFSLQPGSVLGIFVDGIFTHASPFVGITVFLLALCGVAATVRNPMVRTLLGIAVGGLLFAFASHTIFHGILYALIPFVDKARNPAMAVFIFHLGICTLSGFGLDRVLDGSLLQNSWPRRILIGCGAAGIVLWLYVFGFYAAKLPGTIRVDQVSITAFAAVLILATLSAARSSSINTRTAAVLLTGVMLLEIGNLTYRDLANADTGQTFWPQLARNDDIAEFLKRQPAPFRTDYKYEDIPLNFGDWYGIETYWGNVPSADLSMMRVMGLARTKQLFNVKYYVAKAPAFGAEKELYSSAESGNKVFEMPPPMPRAWVVHNIETVAKADDIAARFDSPAFDIARSTLLFHESPPALENCSGDQIHVLHHNPQYVDLNVGMVCKGMVILGDAFSKDWVAYVDGRRVPLYAAYTIIRGVAVDKGPHHIEFRYRVTSFYLGATLSFIALVIILAMWWFDSKSVNQLRDGTAAPAAG